MQAIQAPNVDVHFTPVVEIKPNSVIGGDGTEKEVDTIVCCTGFDVTYRPRFPLVGRNGVDLADKWKNTPEGYLGVSEPSLPNFLTFIGPTFPVEVGRTCFPSNAMTQYLYSANHLPERQRHGAPPQRLRIRHPMHPQASV